MSAPAKTAKSAKRVGAGPPTVRARRANADKRALRRRRVAELMLLELTQDEVAARLAEEDISANRSTISRDMAAIRAEWQAERLEHADEWVRRELRKLRHDEGALRSRLRSIDAEAQHETYAKVYDRVLKVMARRASLLGLDAPTKVDARLEARLEASAHVGVELVDHAALRALEPSRRRQALEAARAAIAGYLPSAPEPAPVEEGAAA